MAKRPTVPKFGTWDSDNVGYTVYFDKVRENKGATAPPLHRPANPNDPVEGPLMAVPPPSSSPSSSSRPATAGGHRERLGGQGHRRTGSNSSDPGGRGAEQSKFAPPPQFQQRQAAAAPAPHQHGGGGGHHAPPGAHGGGHHHAPSGTTGGGHRHAPSGSHAAAAGGGGGHRGHHHHHQHHHHRHAAPASRARSASPQKSTPGRQRASAVPKFGVWDEQSASAAAQGFTVQFENVKKHREVARTGVPNVPRAPSPPPPPRRRSHHRDPFVSKMFGCFLPTVKD